MIYTNKIHVGLITKIRGYIFYLSEYCMILKFIENKRNEDKLMIMLANMQYMLLENYMRH